MNTIKNYTCPSEEQMKSIAEECLKEKPLIGIFGPISGIPCYECGKTIEYHGTPPNPCMLCKVPMCLFHQKQPQMSPAVCEQFPNCHTRLINPPIASIEEIE